MDHLIRNCRFKFKCGAAWDFLDKTDDPTVRYCGGCERTVHLCNTDNELAIAVLQNHCVAIPKEGTLEAIPEGFEQYAVGEIDQGPTYEIDDD